MTDNFNKEWAESSEFIKFLDEMQNLNWETNQTASGETTVQQTLRNKLRIQGVAALLTDLTNLYGVQFDVVETKEGIGIVAENEPTDTTFTWMLKSTIKSLDYDPFMAADQFADEKDAKLQKKQEKQKEKDDAAEALAAKRAKKLAAVEKLEVRQL